MKTIFRSYRPMAVALLCAASTFQHTRGDCVSWDAAIGSPGMDGPVRALATMEGGGVIAGGQFTTAGGSPASNIARWDGDQWHALGEGVNGSVTSLAALSNGDIVAGGSFTMAGGQTANRIARWDGMQWHALGDGFASGTVWTLASLPGSDDIVAGGNFTFSGGTAVSRIARFDGTQWHAMSSGMDAAVHTLAVFDAGDGPRLYAGGEFLTAGGAVVNHLARWDAGASQWVAVDQGVNGAVTAMVAFDDGEDVGLYVAGQMTHAGYVPLFNPVGKWDGEKWWPFSGGLHGTVAAMTVFDDGDGPAMYAIATINDAGAFSQRLMKWDGSWWVTVGELNAPAHALAGDGEMLHVGGSFTMVDGVAAGRLASWQSCPPTEPVLRRVPSDFATIQSAIEAADDGDVVLVGPGTYLEAIDFLGKTIVVESEAGPEKTVIDVSELSASSAVAVPPGSGVGTTLRGFTVTGASNPETGNGSGIGIGGSYLTIVSCRIVSNGQVFGGGILAGLDADILVMDSVISNNHSQHSGAGIVLYRNRGARVQDCLIADNTAMSGAGIYVFTQTAHWLRGQGMFTRCIIAGNAMVKTSQHGTGIGGGGVANFGTTFFYDCEISENAADPQFAPWGTRGGAMLASGLTIVRDTRFIENFASRYGGGIAIWNADVLVIEDCRFSGNAATEGGGAMYLLDGGGDVLISSSFFCESTPDDISGLYTDLGGNTFAESCESTPGDLNGDGVVDVADLLILLGAWGDCPRGLSCPADFNGDGAVDVSDLLVLLENWG